MSTDSRDPAPLDAAAVEVLLCDADDNLFPSEQAAFSASTAVTNAALAELGIDRAFSADELRRWATGRNFRATIQALAEDAGATLAPAWLDARARAEREAVVARLVAVLRPDDAVGGPLARLARRFRLALVSSSALVRVDACVRAAGLEELFPHEARFSAEDSLATPTSKPDPAIYRHAGERLGVAGPAALAIEDAETGVRAAVAAGFPAVGNVQFVPAGERAERVEALRAAGAVAVVSSWAELATLLGG